MKKSLAFLLFFSILFFYFIPLNAQVVSLNRIGQTPGSAGFHVNWDSTAKRLIVGCGTSIWVYDMSDPQHYTVVAKRPFPRPRPLCEVCNFAPK